ncbi:2-oxopent-4-enoate/cis-2-oxohex-4-enoate hydratase [Pseudomonas sp. ok272]|uniref:fumarylacetoacetate hydrolase family protein n=1 Tax=unclassified Pseudomonas TaxID=196821 RepID=UPI0008C9C22D|nr:MULTISPECIES: fumarylacetoacetate hydrolase family protein [unclassified Pseudomonas]SEN42726.1 2-oxopent-4-enoate/cis-2-oxohex-4-enoate hydratase [Pseudomonas sp. ok272]SFN25672.1 2-oxopent-4-enoate/cis-2-oxohex-4-enoate hydratase [Pseudomonas sp. ok602]
MCPIIEPTGAAPQDNRRLRQRLAERLYLALRNGETIEPPTTTDALAIDDAYHISLAILERRQADGEQVIGKKIGVTSKAVQEMLGVHQPDFGFLTDRMQFANDACISLSQANLIQPRAEGEIAFILNRDLMGPGVTRADVLHATESVMACFEIVDSRIRDWKIAIQDTIADNASCGIFVLGSQRVSPEGLDLANVRLDMKRNGEPHSSGLGSAVQGHPAEAVAWLANTLGAFGMPLRAGEIILSGSLVPLVPVNAGDHFELTVTDIGCASIRFTD